MTQHAEDFLDGEGTGTPEEMNPPIDYTGSPPQIVGAWLAEFAAGRTNDQNTVLLGRLIKQKEDAARASVQRPRAPQASPAAAIATFVSQYIDGNEFAEGPFAEYALALDEHIRVQLQVTGTGVTAGEVASAVNESVHGLQETAEALAAAQMQVDRLELELVRAHDWRFHLEAHARDADRAVRGFLERGRGPTKEEMEGVRAMLRSAIGWSP